MFHTQRLQSLHPKVFPKRSQCGINSLGSLVFPEPSEGSDSVAVLTVHRLASAGPSAANRALSCFALRRGELNSELTGTTAYFKDRICPAARCRLSQFVSALSFSSSSSGLKGSRLAQRSQGVCVWDCEAIYLANFFSPAGRGAGKKKSEKTYFPICFYRKYFVKEVVGKDIVSMIATRLWDKKIGSGDLSEV